MACSMGRTDGHVITNGIVIVKYHVRRLHRRLPMRASAFLGLSYPFLLHGLFWARFHFHADLLCAMNPGAVGKCGNGTFTTGRITVENRRQPKFRPLSFAIPPSYPVILPT